MTKILFLIHDLGQGGAEKVLVNLVNNMDASRFDITVMTLFDCGENRRFLAENIHYKYRWRTMPRGNSHFMKLLSPERLHRMIVKEHYDIEVAYLEGPCARVISGCRDSSVSLVSWIHIELHTAKAAASSFRSIKEAVMCYEKFDRIVSVSGEVERCFCNSLHAENSYLVLHNTFASEKVLEMSKEPLSLFTPENAFRLVAVGKLIPSKGFDRLLRVVKRLCENGENICLFILGEGKERGSLQSYIDSNGLSDRVKLEGYQLNPYKYIADCDLFVCASLAEGFSTAAVEALIVGTPVCTVEVAGMKELLGENDEYGLVVGNSEDALFDGIKKLLDDRELFEGYRRISPARGRDFSTEKTVSAVQDLFFGLTEGKKE